MSADMNIGQTVRKYRKIKNLTQVELAKSIGVSMQAVSKWETDVGLPDITQINSIEQSFRCHHRWVIKL